MLGFKDMLSLVRGEGEDFWVYFEMRRCQGRCALRLIEPECLRSKHPTRIGTSSTSRGVDS